MCGIIHDNFIINSLLYILNLNFYIEMLIYRYLFFFLNIQDVMVNIRFNLRDYKRFIDNLVNIIITFCGLRVIYMNFGIFIF